MQDNKTTDVLFTERGYISGNTKIKGNSKKLLEMLRAETLNANVDEEELNLQSEEAEIRSIKWKIAEEKKKVNRKSKGAVKVFTIPLIFLFLIAILYFVICCVAYVLPNTIIGISEVSGNLVQGSISHVIANEMINPDKLSWFLMGPCIVIAMRMAISGYGIPNPQNQEQVDTFLSVASENISKVSGPIISFFLIVVAIVIFAFLISALMLLKTFISRIIARNNIKELQEKLSHSSNTADEIEKKINNLKADLKAMGWSQPRIPQKYCNNESVQFLTESILNEKYITWGEALSACDNYMQNVEIKRNIEAQNVEIAKIRERQEELEARNTYYSPSSSSSDLFDDFADLVMRKRENKTL